MKDVRFLQIFEFCFRADEGTCGEPAIGKMVEEHIIWHKLRNWDDPPACQRLQPV